METRRCVFTYCRDVAACSFWCVNFIKISMQTKFRKIQTQMCSCINTLKPSYFKLNLCTFNFIELQHRPAIKIVCLSKIILRLTSDLLPFKTLSKCIFQIESLMITSSYLSFAATYRSELSLYSLKLSSHFISLFALNIMPTEFPRQC